MRTAPSPWSPGPLRPRRLRRPAGLLADDAPAGRPPPGHRSAALLAFPASHAQGRPRERLQPRLADRVPAVLAHAVGAVVDAGQSPLGLAEDLAVAGCE